jgi:hypothetical protein
MKTTDSLATQPSLPVPFSVSEELHGALASAQGLLMHNKVFAQAQDIATGAQDYLSTHAWARKTAEYGGAALLAGGAIIVGSRLSRLPTGAKAVEELLNADAFSILSKRSLRLLAGLQPTAEVDKASPYQVDKAIQELRSLASSDRSQPNWITRVATAVNNLGHPKIATHLFDRAVIERPPIVQDFSPTSLQQNQIDLERQISSRQQDALHLLMERGGSQLKAGMIPQANRSFDIAEAHAGQTWAIFSTVNARTKAMAAAMRHFEPVTWNGIVSARSAAPIEKVDSLMQEIAPNQVAFAKSFLRRLEPTPQALKDAAPTARSAARELHRLARGYETTEFYRQGPYIGQDYNPHWEANVGIALKNMGHQELALRYLNPYLDQRLARAERLASLPLNSGLETASRLKVADALIAQGQALGRLDHPRAAWISFKQVQSVAPPRSPQFFQSEIEQQAAAQANRIRF